MHFNWKEYAKTAGQLLPAAIAAIITLIAAAPFDTLSLLDFKTPDDRISFAVAAAIAIGASSYVYLFFQDRELDVTRAALKEAKESIRALELALTNANARTEQALERASSRAERSSSAIRASTDGLSAAIGKLVNNRTAITEARVALSALTGSAKVMTNLIGPYFLSRLDTMLNDQHFRVKGGFLFQEFYRDAFKHLNGPCHLIASARATNKYMWGPKDLNPLFHEFTQRPDCSLARVFIIEDDFDIHGEEAQDIMQGQKDAGVHVHWITESRIAQVKESVQLCLADMEGTFSWTLETTPDGVIEQVEASWNEDEARDRYRYLKTLVRHATEFKGKSANVD